jgi:DNA-binding FadR family transcriptional regulator
MTRGTRLASSIGKAFSPATDGDGLAYQRVADELRALILAGDLPPGDRLPSEPDLTVRFGVGRSTIREALRVLSSENLIETSRGIGGGSFVVPPQPEQVTNYLERSLSMLTVANLVTVDELLAAREMLEVPAARLAAANASAAQIDEIRDSLPSKPDRQDLAHMFECNLNFHLRILESSGNRLLEVMTRPLFTVMRTRFLRDAAPKRFWRKVASDHESIFGAVEASDSDRAGEQMRQHLAHLRTTYERIDRRDGKKS